MKTNRVARKRTLKTPKGTVAHPIASEHMKKDHIGRSLYIQLKLGGFGNIVKEVRYESEENGVGYKCITDNGIIIIKSADRTKLVTNYVASLHQLYNLYPDKNQIPIQLLNVVKRHHKNKEVYNSEHFNPDTGRIE